MPNKKRTPGLLDQVIARQPRYYRDTAGDAVRWNAVNEKGETRGNWQYTACFAPIIPGTRPWEVTCEPYPRGGVQGFVLPNRLSKVDYQEFMALNKSVGLVPKVARTFRTEKGNCMILPRGLDRHTAYVALCMYRYADSKVRSMRTALQIRRQTGLPWLQVLHYVMACKKFGCGHGFINLSWSENRTEEALNSGNAIALARFCNMSVEQRGEIGDRKSTYMVLHEMANTVNPRIRRKAKWGTIEDPRYSFASFEDILNPCYSLLYTTPTLDQIDLAWIMTRGSTKNEPT